MIANTLYSKFIRLASSVTFFCLTAGQLHAGPATTDRLVIKYKQSNASSLRSAQALKPVKLNEAAGEKDVAVSFHRKISDSAMVLSLDREMSLEEAQKVADQLAKDPKVEYAHPDKRMYPAYVPNDPEYVARQWNLYEGKDSGGLFSYGINVQKAWDISRGNPNLVIAVLDSGILDHTDINPARVLPGYDFLTKDDHDAQPGRDPFPLDPGDAVLAGECGMEQDGTPIPEFNENSSWHGLSVAGIIMAESDNSNDLAGIDFSARLLPVRVLGKCGGYSSDINDAIRWAAGLPVNGVPDNQNPAKVINLSLSGEDGCWPNEQAAINDVINAGAIVVAAAGNGAGNANLNSPANCQGVITVAATRQDGGLTSYSSTGSVVDFSVPGGDALFGRLVVLSNTGETVPGADELVLSGGTSFSAAQVTAAISLLLSVKDDLTVQQVQGILKATAQPFPVVADTESQCTTDKCGEGIMDLYAAMELASDPLAEIPVSYDPPNTFSLGGGGGGCILASSPKFDLTWLLIGLVSLLRLNRLSKRQTI